MVSKALDERRQTIEHLRDLCRTNLPGEESMDYGMPCYKREGVSKPGHMDFQVIERLLRRVVESGSVPC
jgi:hypothetical protein